MINKIFLLTFGLLIIILNIYFRFFRQKDEITLAAWKVNLTLYDINILVFFFITQNIIFFSTLYFLYKKYKKI